MNGLKGFPSKGVSTNFYRLQYYDGMCFDKMCEGGPKRLVQRDGNAGTSSPWVGPRATLGKRPSW